MHSKRSYKSRFLAEKTECLDLRSIKDLACVLDVHIPELRVALDGSIVKYFIT